MRIRIMRRLFVYNFIVFYIAPPRCGFSQLLSDALSPNRRNSLRKRTSREINPTSQPLTGKAPVAGGLQQGLAMPKNAQNTLKSQGQGVMEKRTLSEAVSLHSAYQKSGLERRAAGKGGQKGTQKPVRPAFHACASFCFSKYSRYPLTAKAGTYVRA